MMDADEKARKLAGSINGKHFTSYVDQVKVLRRLGQDAKAASLLLKLVCAVEAEAAVAGPDWCISPWYYEQLALIYRKSKDFGFEVEILERYIFQSLKTRNPPFANIAERLEKARLLKDR